MTANLAPSVSEHSVDVWAGRLTIRVKVAGTGTPVLYLHSFTELAWDPFLSRLSERHTVYAPEFPGTSVGDPYAVRAIDELPDLVLAYDEVVRSLGLDRPAVVGHSFGGMLAAEFAAYFPDRLGQLVLIDPIGLWRDDEPVTNLAAVNLQEMPGLLFSDPAAEAVQAAVRPPEDLEAARAAVARRIWSLGCTAKFVWPIPDRGLRARLHRVTAATLIVWGRQDRIVPVGYASEFAGLIAGSKVALIDDCGHLPQVEQLGPTASVVEEFLDTVSSKNLFP